MIPILRLDNPSEQKRVEALLKALRLDPAEVALSRGKLGEYMASVQAIVADVAQRGDEAIVEASRRFDDPDYTAQSIRVAPEAMREAAGRIPSEQRSAIRHAIAQVREYQKHMLPADPRPLHRGSVELGMRFTPLDSAGLYFPGGKAAYPSSLIMLAVPAQVAGVGRIIACTTPSRYGRSDLVLAAAHELGIAELYQLNGIAAIAAMAFGTETIAAVDKIVGPGHTVTQLAKRLVAGVVGIDGYLGPSEIVVLADQSAEPAFVAADLIAQAEHDPGSCFLLTDSPKLAEAVAREIGVQLTARRRQEAIEPALREHSAIIVGASMEELIELANRFAAEHVSLQVADEEAVLTKLKHAGAVFIGAYSPVAAGDYVAGPSHCLPTNTTARFASGISVWEFLKRSSVVRYSAEGLKRDAAAIEALAEAEHLDGHAASVRIRHSEEKDGS